MSDEEDKYILSAEAEQIARARRQRQLEALRREEREGIAKALLSSEDVANEALELGFDRETARVLHLVPLIQMAWADDTVTDDERDKVLELAHERGIDSGSPGHDFLELLLKQRPAALFFERTNTVIAHLLADDPTGRETEDLMERVRSVAEASSDYFGFQKINKDERTLLDDLAKLFKLQ